MRVLVTGGAGYIGSHAVRALQRVGHDVVVLDDFSHGHAWAVEGFPLVQLNVNNSAHVAQALTDYGIEAVLHFAAFIEVGESVSDPAKYYMNNFCGGIALLRAMQQAGVRRLVFSSTAAVYGTPMSTPIQEDHPCHPINPYGKSKWMMEQALADFAHAYGFGYTALRYFNVAGASPVHPIGEAHQPESHLIPRVLAAATDPEAQVTIFGSDYPTADGTCIRDYIHVEDLVDAHLLALKSIEPGKGRVYNLGNQNGFSVRQVIDVCRSVTGKPINVREEARRPGDPPILVASSARIMRELGWAPRYPALDTIVRHAWEWHQSHLRDVGACSLHAQSTGACKA